MSHDAWQDGPTFTSARADFALAMTAGALYAIAGDTDGGFFFDATNQVERLDLSAWPAGDWESLGDPLPKSLSANQAGFCTGALIDPAAAEVWSVGGLDPNVFIIEGRAFFRESPGETCYSIYSDVPWLTIGTPDGSVGAGESLAIDVHVDAAGLAPGVYTAYIVVVSNDPGGSQHIIEVTVLVGGTTTIFLPVIVR
jgi:hypothetical protein